LEKENKLMPERRNAQLNPLKLENKGRTKGDVKMGCGEIQSYPFIRF
jgi:hypothetical protein